MEQAILLMHLFFFVEQPDLAECSIESVLDINIAPAHPGDSLGEQAVPLFFQFFYRQEQQYVEFGSGGDYEVLICTGDFF